MAELLIPTDTTQATLGYLLEDGSIPLTADWDAGAFKITANEFRLNDSEPATFGTGAEATLKWDGSDFIITLPTGAFKAVKIVEGDLIVDSTHFIGSETGGGVTFQATGSAPELEFSGAEARWPTGVKFQASTTTVLTLTTTDITAGVKLISSGAYLPVDLTNTTDNASVEALRLQGNRATMANDDESFVGLYLSDDGGTQVEYGRWTWIATAVAAAAKAGALRLDLIQGNSLGIGMFIDPARTNLFLGDRAGNDVIASSGTGCTFIGSGAGNAGTSGVHNTFIGADAGLVATGNVNDNVCIGWNAGVALTSGDSNVFIGSGAGSSNLNGLENIFIGKDVGSANETGRNNTFIGTGAGAANTGGDDSVFIGLNAGNATTGSNNTFVGKQTGALTDVGVNNCFFGSGAGDANTSGNDNVFMGIDAGGKNTTSADNTFVGKTSGSQNTDGNNNAALGSRSGRDTTTGVSNVFIGSLAGSNNTTGAFNVYLGRSAGGSVGTSNSIAIGFASLATANNQMVLGSANASGVITDAYIGSGVTKASPAALALQTTGGSGTNNAGAAFSIAGGKGTGNAAGGTIFLKTSVAGASGTTLQSLVERMAITPTSIIVNETGADVDLRAESVNEDKLFYIDAGADEVRLGDFDTNYFTTDNAGDSWWVGGGGLPFAEIFAHDNATPMTLNSAAKVQITIFDTDGVSNNMTPAHAQDHITVVKAGMYFCAVSVAVLNGAGAAHKIECSVWKLNGGTEFLNVHGHRNLSAGTDLGSITMNGFIDLAVNDTIEVWLDTDRGSDSAVTVEDITLSLMQVGGT